MPIKLFAAMAVAACAFGAVGCGSSAPEHVEKPLATRPQASASEFDKLKTPEEKIKYIENSGAPEVEKKRAIEQIKSGKL
jgi:hypothetical protein